MVSLVFHGGHYKTGTTSVQSALREKEAALLAGGILYPANPEGSQFGKLQHAELLTNCAEGKFDHMVALQGTHVVAVPLAKAIKKQKLVDPRGELVRVARDTGISFGDR